MKSKLLYKDKAGNQLYKKTIKTRGTIQLSVKNREGRLVNVSGTKKIIGEARRKGKLRL